MQGRTQFPGVPPASRFRLFKASTTFLKIIFSHSNSSELRPLETCLGTSKSLILNLYIGRALFRNQQFDIKDIVMETYAAFQERVKRTIYVDNLSPLVTEAILKAAFEQFCDVVSIEFIPNYICPQTLPQAVLVEMRTESDAGLIIAGISNNPFMICGMPRPVRVRAAEEEMFDNRPQKSDKSVTFQWLDTNDPNFVVARKMKNLTRKHAAEAEFLLNHQLEEEEKLAKQQEETLKASYKKYEVVEGVVADGTAAKLAQEYKMHLVDG